MSEIIDNRSARSLALSLTVDMKKMLPHAARAPSYSMFLRMCICMQDVQGAYTAALVPKVRQAGTSCRQAHC